MPVVGFDDILDQPVAYHVPLVKMDEPDPVDVLQDPLDLHEPRHSLRRQVHLRDVSGHDGLGIEAKPRQEHLHLLGRGVLRFVENDEGIIEGAPAHEGQRRDLDIPPFDQAVCPLHVHHVVERIVERPEVGVDLRVHIPRQEPELLAGFHSRPGEDDAADLLPCQSRHRHGHGQVGFAGPGRSDRNHDVEFLNGLDVGFLGRRLGNDEPLLRGDRNRAGEEIFERGVLIAARGQEGQ